MMAEVKAKAKELDTALKPQYVKPPPNRR